ncbi:Flap endonuclease 1 [Leucoagaricus sp. SymC.cos]|nr:Flap endonuclease 1 [Leucoagaricus sp. SymC.cos]
MGVLGLTPFLQKNYPQIIHKLPNRLKDLAGKRLVIDGTLITQRLHYAPSPHPFRHVLGWYHLAREMNENGVSAICIFDGQKRSKAKAKEVGRRREIKRLDVFRGNLEQLRMKRLEVLKTTMSSVRSLDDRGRSTIAEMLSRLHPNDGPLVEETPDEILVSREETLVESTHGSQPQVKERPRQLSCEVSPIPSTPDKIPVVTESAEAPVDSVALEHVSQPQDSSFLGLQSPPVPGIPVHLPSAEDLKWTLLSSYRDFRTSISKIASLPLPKATTPPAPSPLTSEDEESNTEDDIALTKTQCELTLEEDNFVLHAAEDRLDALKTRSELVSDSYQRRMCVPTRNTYMESKEILEAMGVLCYEIEGEYEGEALASSLVMKGLADYVVSEDSDVLVYEAPLIRNITGRCDPLVLIHGSDVRSVLELSRDSYIDFALLLGTDFSERIKNVGPSRAHKFIKEYGTIENVIGSQSKFQPKTSRTDYLAQVNSARAVFNSLPPLPDRLAVSMLSTEFGVVDTAKVNVIMERCGLGKALMLDACWDYEAALEGNYFDDNPAQILS